MRVTLDAVLARRGVTAKAVAEEIGISETQLSMFRSGKVRGLRFATLSKLCLVLDCRHALGLPSRKVADPSEPRAPRAT